MVRGFKRGSYRRNVAVLASGTAIAQAVPIALSPILTRLYAPEDFGLLALYAAIAYILTSVSTAQYETAITLPANDEDAACLVSLTVRICGIFSFVLLVTVSIFNQQIAHFFGHPEIAAWLYLLPVSVMASGIFKAYSFWCIRRSAYDLIAKQSVQLGLVTGSSSVAFGMAGVANGQIMGIVVGRILSAASIAHFVIKTDKSLLNRKTGKSLYPVAKRYVAHPTHFMPAKLIDDFALQIPVFMISNIFLISTVGFFSLAYRLVSLPTALVANAIGNVYRQQISESYNQYSEYRAQYKKTLRTTCMIALPPFSVLYLIAPSLFSFVFGQEWRVAGDYAQILVVSTFFSFITTPLNKGSIVVGAKKYALTWNTARLASFLTVWGLAYTLTLEIEQVLWCLVTANVCLYLTDAYFQYRFSLGTPQDPSK